MRVMWSALTLLSLVVLLSGCFGDSAHTVDTGYNGSLRGLDFDPAAQSLDISTDTDFVIYWRSGYEPPREFTVALYEIDASGNRTTLNTYLEQDSSRRYRLVPASTLPTSTFLLVRVYTVDEEVRAMYLTRNYRNARAAAPTTAGPAQAEHTVHLP